MVVSTSAIGQNNCPAPGFLSGTITIPTTYLCNGVPVPGNLIVTYAYPDPNGNVLPLWQYRICRIIFPIDPSCSTSSVSPNQMREIGRQLITLNPAGFPCAPECDPSCLSKPGCPCPTASPRWEVSWTQCWRSHPGLNQGPIFIGCETTSESYCVDLYHICCNNGAVREFLAGSSSTQTNCTYSLKNPADQGLCSSMCAGPPSPPPGGCNGIAPNNGGNNISEGEGKVEENHSHILPAGRATDGATTTPHQ